MIRPADATETAEAWRVAIEHKHGPVCLVLTRQKLGFIDREKYASADGVAKGGYVLADAKGGDAAGRADVERLARWRSIIAAREKLAEQGVRARVVSMPSHGAVRAAVEPSIARRCCRRACRAWRSRRRTR